MAGLLTPLIFIPILFLFVRYREVENSDDLGNPIQGILKLRCTDEDGLSYRLHGGNCRFNRNSGIFSVTPSGIRFTRSTRLCYDTVSGNLLNTLHHRVPEQLTLFREISSTVDGLQVVYKMYEPTEDIPEFMDRQ